MEDEFLTVEQVSILRNKQTELISIMEAYNFLEQTKEWQLIKEAYRKQVESIEVEISSEVSKPVIDINKLYRLQGELTIAKRHSNTDRFVESLKVQLEGIKSRLKNAK